MVYERLQIRPAFGLRYILGGVAVGEIGAFDHAIGLINADISALPEESIAVRENWKEKRTLSQEATLRAFAPATVARPRQDIAPLMQWRNIRGLSDAYGLDLPRRRDPIRHDARSTPDDTCSQLSTSRSASIRRLAPSL